MSLGDSLRSILVALANDHSLEPRRHDHALSGEWKDCRDCQVKPDLVLIYQKPDADTLRLVRLGSHSELGLCGAMMDNDLISAAEIVGSRGNSISPHFVTSFSLL